MIEPLESRRLASAVAVGVGSIHRRGGTLTIRGNPALGNVITVSYDATGPHGPAYVITVDGATVAVDVGRGPPVHQLRVYGAAFPDRIAVDPNVTARAVVFGGGGNDTLSGGSGINQLYGGGGCDTLTGGAGPNFLYGGGGDDDLAGGPGDDRLVGGPGAKDSLNGDGGIDVLIVQPGHYPSPGDTAMG